MEVYLADLTAALTVGRMVILKAVKKAESMDDRMGGCIVDLLAVHLAE